MTDEGGEMVVVDPVEDPVVTEPMQPGEFVNPDGTFKDGWRELIPEDFRGRQVFQIADNLPSLLKTLGNADALIKRQGKGVMVPTKDSTPTEVEMFFEQIGRPKTAAEYKIEVPDDLKEFYDEAVLANRRTELHKAGLTQKQVDVVMGLDAREMADGVKADKAAVDSALERAEAALHEKWGDAFKERMHVAKRMIEENLPDEERAPLLSLIGNNPAVADFLATIGKKFMEGTFVEGAGSAGALTPEECRGRAKELMETPGYVAGTLPPATADRLTREIADLYRKAEGQRG